MAEWSFKRETTEVQEGPHRVRITAAQKAISKQGNDMLKITLQVSGSDQPLYHYITFMKDKPELTNKLLTQFFDSFPGIPEGEFDTSKWVGAEGAAMIKQDVYNGLPSPRINWFIHRNRQGDIPEFVDTKAPTKYNKPLIQEGTSGPQQMQEQHPSPQEQTQEEPQQQPQQDKPKAVTATILPDGRLQMPDGTIVEIAGFKPKQEDMGGFGPNKSWNEEQQSGTFNEALDKFMGGN